MSLAFLTSWRAALSAAGLVTLTVAGRNLAFGPDAETRLAERRIAQMFPSGEASNDILDRAIAAGIPYTDFGITLREIVALFPDAIVTYEPLSTTAFVARLSMINHLTLEPLEFAFRFVVANGPEDYGAMARSPVAALCSTIPP